MLARLLAVAAFTTATLGAARAGPTGNDFIDAVAREAAAAPTTPRTLDRRAAAMLAHLRALQNRGDDLSAFDAALAGAGGNLDQLTPAAVDAGLAALAKPPTLLEPVQADAAAGDGGPADWPTLLGDAAHTGRTDSAGAAAGRVAWTVGVGSRWRAGPVVRDGVVYVASPGTMTTAYALDEATGAVRWRALRYGRELYGVLRAEGPVRLAGERVIVPLLGGDGRVAAFQHLDAATGRVLDQRSVGPADKTFRTDPLDAGADLVVHLTPRADGNRGVFAHRQEVLLRETGDGRTWWTFPVGEAVGEPVLAGQSLFVASTGGLYKLIRDGDQRVAWFAATDAEPVGGPVFSGDDVLLPLIDRVVAFGPDGRVRWTLAGVGEVAHLAADDSSIAAVADGKVVAVKNGKAAWTADDPATTTAVGGGAIYSATTAGELRRHGDGGRVAWTTRVSDFPILAAPAVTQTCVLVQPADGSLVAVGFDGKIRWRHRLMETATVAGEEVLADAVPGQYQASPVLTGDRLTYAGPTGHVVSVDLDGRELWRVDIGGKISGTPTFGDGAHYVGQYGGRESDLVAVNADGTIRWRADVGWCWATPAYADGAVYAATTAGDVVALDARTGERRWTFRAGEGCYTPPTLGDGRLFVGSWDGHYYRLDPKTGRVVWAWRRPGWAYQFGGKPDSAMPTFADGKLFVQALGGFVIALDAATGRTSWQSDWAAGRANNGGTAFVDGLLLSSTFRSPMTVPHDANLAALDAKTGKAKWTLPGLGGLTAPVVAAGRLYAGSTGAAAMECHELRGDGQTLRWRTRLGGIVEESVPAAGGGRTYVIASDGVLYAVE